MVARAAQDAGIAGLAFFSGIPGTIGGALRMNGGAYGGETKDVLVEARGIDRQGNARSYSNAEMGFSYRHCGVPDDVIFTAGAVPGPRRRSRGNRRRDGRDQNQARGEPAAQPHRRLDLQEPAGHERLETGRRSRLPRAHRSAGAQVSELHCNFLINLGGATAADIETLGETVRERVKAHSGVELEWEIKRIGVNENRRA